MTQPENLMEFLLENTVEGLTDDVRLELRRSGKKKLATFKIKTITQKEWDGYTKQTNVIKKGGKVEFDEAKFRELVILNHVVEPDFKNVESIKAAGCQLPMQLVSKVLLPGEVSKLVEEISALSGFNSTVEDLKEEVKN